MESVHGTVEGRGRGCVSWSCAEQVTDKERICVPQYCVCKVGREPCRTAILAQRNFLQVEATAVNVSCVWKLLTCVCDLGGKTVSQDEHSCSSKFRKFTVKQSGKVNVQAFRYHVTVVAKVLTKGRQTQLRGARGSVVG
jgi:hypothetical protein